MSGHEDYKTAKQRLEDFLKKLDNYVECINYKPTAYQEEFETVSNLKLDELDSLSKDTLFNYAYLLTGYCNYLQEEVNKHSIILKWCNDQLNALLVKYEKEVGFDVYTKYESKMPTLILENQFAHKVYEMKQVAESRVMRLDGIMYQIKRQGEIFLERAKRK